MLIIGGEINTGIEGVPAIFDRRDERMLLDSARQQIDGGAAMLGINLGGRADEKEELAWAVRTIQREFPVPIAIDTPDLDVFRFGLEAHNDRWGKPLLNSTTADPERLDRACRLAAEKHVPIVALPTRGIGAADSIDEKLRNAATVVRAAGNYGIPASALHIDPMLYPISTGDDNGVVFLRTLSRIKSEFPDVKTICGIDNVSCGLPGREIVSAVFLAMSMTLGLDGVIMKTNRMHHATIRAGLALLGRDESCMGYIEAYRSGIWDPIID